MEDYNIELNNLQWTHIEDNNSVWNTLSSVVPVAFGEIWNATQNSSAANVFWPVNVGAMPNITHTAYSPNNPSFMQVEELQGLACGLNQSVNCDNSNLTVLYAGVYRADWSMSVKGAAIPNNLTVSILVNNQTNSHWDKCMALQSSAVVAGVFNMGGGCLLQLNANDRISLGMYTEVTAATTWNIRNVQLIIERLI
jgi:hypothetical protein